ncbi:DUF2207 domain-containing protein [Leucobacter sp. G161]|uniref:DUF2207 domain-containing protein n=1 Tax=Leucobacter sp. G161 TaxID=663704 RepID=UPI00073C58B5|nr:DUF2207 domain-containing protein [Leucobacter sp. G161]KUF06756.1 hypothetical protein AUL38_10865 [Leucobacter sp. G161]
MSPRAKKRSGSDAAAAAELPGSDFNPLSSGRIPDPQPEHTPLFRWLAGRLDGIEQFLRARGGKGLRTGIRLFWGLLAAIGVFLLVGPVLNKPMSFDDVIAAANVSDVDWIARDAAIDYEVDRAPDGTFSARVTERFLANFANGPEPDVVRTLVTEVNGNDAEFALLGALIDGVPADTTVKRHPITTDVTMRAPGGERLDGEREIVLEYELHHLARPANDRATGEAIDEWNWPLFAPSWPQATKGLEVSVTLPRVLDEALVRQPHATVGWLLVSGNVWLTPNTETAETVSYAFENTDSLPPHADVWVEFSFAEGTFAQPQKTALFWVQTWGPLLPLGALALLMLFALAARWIVWADSAGEPWFTARDEPPSQLSPMLAAELMEKPRHAELVAELAAGPPEHSGVGGSLHGLWLRAIAQAGRRAGRLGNLPAVFRWRSRWARQETAVEQRLRWRPDSYVRDTFILAPIAVTLLQWGLLRQLSHQVILLVVWWPALFVLASTVIAAVALWAVARPRPLTRKGALAVQQLRGIDVFARTTRLLDRGPVTDPLLPYAVLFSSPRTAGNVITAHAERDAGERGLAAGWRGEHFLSIPALLSLVAAGALFAGSIVLVSTQPAPYGQDEFLTWPSSESRGSIWSQTEGFSIEAELTRDSTGGAKLAVTEHITAGFAAGGASVPQFEREWPRERQGQDLGLEVEAVLVDGAEVPFTESAGSSTTKITTKLSEVRNGTLPVEVRYSLASPAVEVRDGGGVAQQLRWTAMHWFWDDTFYAELANPYAGSEPVRPIRVQLTIAPELVEQVQSGGWIGHGDPKKIPMESGTGLNDWRTERDMYTDAGRIELLVGAQELAADGALVVTVDADEVQSRPAPPPGEAASAGDAEYVVDATLNAGLGQHELGLGSDLGAVLNFADGTFTNVTEGAAKAYRAERAAPLAGLAGFTGLVFAAAAGLFVFALRRAGAAGPSIVLTSFVTLPLLATAQAVVFWWVTGPMAGSEGAAAGLIVASLVMWAAIAAQWIAVVRGAATAPNRATTRDTAAQRTKS